MKDGSVFVTGCYRSGTTLLGKVLSAFPGGFVGYQPMTSVFLAAKAHFLDLNGTPSDLPLDPLFPAPSYTPEDFYRFLCDFRFAELPAPIRDNILDRLDAPLREASLSGDLQDVRRNLVMALAQASGREFVQWSGEKEIVCEEFVPYLLNRDVRVFLIVRDPRDVVRSAHMGAARRYVGDNRPVLFTLRTWRKSVAFALRFRHRENLTVVRFEDLLGDSARTIERLAAALATELNGRLDLAELAAQQGSHWVPNSSHPGGHRPELPPGLQCFIETVCGPEMRAMGYECDTEPGTDQTVSSFREPWPITHRLFRERPMDLATELARESKRLENLAMAKPLQPDLFVFGQATHADLRETMAA